MQSYSAKLINLTIQLGEGNFGNSGFNTVTLRGLRVEAHLSSDVGSAPGMGMVGSSAGSTLAIVTVYGLTLSQINQFSKAGTVYERRNNLITIEAGDATGTNPVFKGQIIEAYPQFEQSGPSPNTPFVISAVGTGVDISMKPVPAVSFPGAADVATIMGQLAKNAGLTLENNGVNIKLSSPYYAGTTMDQIVRCAAAANIFAYIDNVKAVLAIWPKNGSRSGGAITISPATGMVGYPQFEQTKVTVATLFNPNIHTGSKITVQSQLMAANGTFIAALVDHEISAQMPDGPWTTVVQAYSMPTPAGNVTVSDIKIS